MMQRPMMILLAGLALLAAACPAAEAATANAIEREIAQLEQEVNAAYAANSLDKYFSYYADDLVAIFYNERWTLARYRQEWPKYVKAGNVVVSARLSRHADGKTIDEHAFETDVWTKRKGAWKITHAHYALAVPAP